MNTKAQERIIEELDGLGITDDDLADVGADNGNSGRDYCLDDPEIPDFMTFADTFLEVFDIDEDSELNWQAMLMGMFLLARAGADVTYIMTGQRPLIHNEPDAGTVGARDGLPLPAGATTADGSAARLRTAPATATFVEAATDAANPAATPQPAPSGVNDPRRQAVLPVVVGDLQHFRDELTGLAMPFIYDDALRLAIDLRTALASSDASTWHNRAETADAVIADLTERSRVGTAKYGTPLYTHNGREALMDAYQEALDLLMYLRQFLLERRDMAKDLAAAPPGGVA